MIDTPLARLAKSPAFAVLAIVLAVAAAYHNSLPGALFFDDQSSVVENPSIRSLRPSAELFAPPVEAGVAGRPVANFTFALNYAVSGLRPWSYHAGNVALHALCALALYGIARRTLLRSQFGARTQGDAAPLALAIALLWAVHPVPSGVVDYVSQRTEALAALCYLLTLLGFIRTIETGSRWWQLASISACALGMGSKEVMVTAPVLVLLYDRTLIAGTFRAAWFARRSYYMALGATWLLLAGLMLNSRLGDRGIGFGLGVTGFSYAVTECGAVLRYLWLSVWPSPLVFDYGWSFVRDPVVALLCVAGLAAVVGVVAVGLWRRRAWGLAGAWFLLLLAPSSSIVPVIQQPVAENRVYLALAGIVALGVVSAYALLGRRAWQLLAGAAVVGCVLTVQRNLDYADEISLWTDTVVKRPQNARAHSNLAAALLLAGRIDDALQHALAAVRLRPGYPDAHTNAGGALVQLGRVDEALPHFEAALAKLPDSAAAHYNLANALLRAGRTDEALARFAAALRLNPNHAQAHNDLSVALLQLGRTAEAITHGNEAVRIAPRSADAHYNLGNALAAASRTAESFEQFTTAIRLKPDFSKAHHNLGVALLRSGRAAEAVAAFETALRLNPGYAEARRNLEVARRAAAP
jgi:tetratricopeptide (TPR) repeat protein